MKRLSLVLTLLASLAVAPLVFSASVGSPAPNFTASDSNGKLHNLSDFKGKYLVLEWHNPDCPFVKSQYKGKMQKLQAKWVKKGVVWCTVISSAPGMEGYLEGPQANEDVKKNHAHPSFVFLDPHGVIGSAYGAKTTPHMFVINPQGVLIYNGAIDNAPLTNEAVSKNEDGDAYVNYVDKALTETLVDKKPEPLVKTTTPYGCGVKYEKKMASLF